MPSPSKCILTTPSSYDWVNWPLNSVRTIEEGKGEKEEEIILALLKSGLLTDEQIAQTTGATPKQVQRIKASIKNRQISHER